MENGIFDRRVSHRKMKKKAIVLFAAVLLVISCGPKVFKQKWTKEMAPETFSVRFETSKGIFDVEVTRNLSPKAADRFYQLVKHHYFDNAIFYRVNPGFVAQFGTSDSITYKSWDAVKLPDEEVLQGNQKGTLSFGRSGKNTRTTNLFINLNNNSYLDTISYEGVVGFPTFGEVVKGMEVVESLYSGYADTTMDSLDLMYTDPKGFLKKYPELDQIKRMYLLVN